MAAEESINSGHTAIESMVNRWIVDYYGFRALDFFKRNQYEDFCGVRDVLHKVFNRPVETTDATSIKIKILQFLCRIIEGENLSMFFEKDRSITPLESALMMLQNWQECNILHEDLGFEKVCSSVKEMMVGILIKNCEFDKASKMLEKHFPKPMVGKKATFMSLIRQRNNNCRVIGQIDFHQFKDEMLCFCKKLCTFDDPFLHEVAKQAVGKRQQNDRTSNDKAESGQSSSPHLVSWKPTVMQKTRLRAAYQVLAKGPEEKSFAQLEAEVEREGPGRKEDFFLCLSHTHEKSPNREHLGEKGLFQRQSGSPMEASPADQPPQIDALLQTQVGTLSNTPSVAQLVIQPDSQVSSLCTIAHLELQTGDRTEQPAESPIKTNKKDLQCPLTENEISKPTRILPRRKNRTCNRTSTSWVEVSEDSEDAASVSVSNGEIGIGEVHNESNNALNRNFTKSNVSSLDTEEEPKESSPTSKTPVQKPHKRLTSSPLSKQVQIQDPGNVGDVCIIDSSLDRSPSQLRLDAVPQTSSTPQRVSTQEEDSSHLKWKRLFKEAKESKETWSDEESHVNIRDNHGLNESTLSNSSHRKRMWTESETERLKEGVKKFGEGQWSKIRSYCKFKDRTNVNLKDRWRTMKKLNLV